MYNRPSTWLAAAVALVLQWGCETGDAPIVSRLDVEREGWNALVVEVDFAREKAAVAPDAETVYVFDAHYDTLYAGPADRIPIPDETLGDAERILIEACGRFDAESICEQRVLTASPKRLVVEEDISFPEDSDFELGAFTFDFVVQRQTFGGEGWEAIPPSWEVTGYLLAEAGNGDGPGVKIPFHAASGRFDLSRHEGFRDFQYQIKSQLHDRPEARVSFEVFAGLGAEPERVASRQMWVHAMTQDEHEEKLASFLKQLAPRLLERVDVHERASLHVDDWTFDETHDRYDLDVELRWRGERSRSGRLRGRLSVRDDGKDVQFRRMEGKDRDRDRWASRLTREVIYLESLDLDPDPDDQELAAADRRR